MKPSMTESWWAAHELEFWVDVAIFAVFMAFAIPSWIGMLWRERARKRRDGIL